MSVKGSYAALVQNDERTLLGVKRVYQLLHHKFKVFRFLGQI